MKTGISILLLSLLAFLAPAQGLKYSQYPQTNVFHNGFLILWADPGKTNYSQSGSDFIAQITSLGNFTTTNINVTYITNFYGYITNLFSTTEYVTNIYVLSLTNAGVAASSAVITDSHQVETNAVNAHGVFTNTAGGPPSFGLLRPTELINTGTAGTYTKTTFNAQGLEISGATATLASADYANQGTTTTLLHGNAAGNPSWASVVDGDISGTLTKNTTGSSGSTTNYWDTNTISLSFSWGGPSNTFPVDQGIHFYTTTTGFSFTNLVAVSGSNLWSTVVVSNQLSTSVTGYCTIPGIRIYGVPSVGGSSNAVVVPAGKTLIASGLSISTLITNLAIQAQSN